MSIARQFAVNVVAQGIARVLSIGANLALLVVVARSMGTEAFGQFSYVLSFSTILVGLADLGTASVLARGLGQHEEARAAYLGNFLLMRFVLTLVVMCGALAAVFALPGELTAALLIVVVGLPVFATRFFEPIYQVYRRPWLSPVSNAAFGSAQLLLALAIWLRPNLSMAQISAGLVITNLVYTAFAFRLILSFVKPDLRPSRELLRNILRFSGPIGVASIFTTIISRADVIILTHLRGDTEAGLYSAAYRVLDIAVFLAITVITPMVPILTQQIAQDRQTALVHCRMAAQFAGLFSLPVVILVPAIGPSVLHAVFGAEFVAAAAPLNILVVNFVLIVLTLLCSSIMVAHGDVNHCYWIAPSACVLNLSLNFLLIPPLGMVGAALSAVASQVAMLVAINVFLVTRFGNPYRWNPWARILLACLVLWGCLHVTEPAGPLVSAALSLGLYGAVVAWLGLIPSGLVGVGFTRRLKRRLGPTA
jgi:O-antigen/teichoic acid export membrane protein